MADVHWFLIDRETGRLTDGARKIPELRERIEELPETRATFKPAQLVEGNARGIHPEMWELVGSWPVPERYTSARAQRWTNPNYRHIEEYADIMVRCACGKWFSDLYETDPGDEHYHMQQCRVYDRLRVRAEIHEQRHEIMRRTSWLGWKGVDMAPRLALQSNNVGNYARKFGSTLTEMRQSFCEAAAKTFVHLVRIGGEDPETVGDVYGYHPTTIRRWVNEKLDEQDYPQGYKLTRDDGGRWGWEYDPWEVVDSGEAD